MRIAASVALGVGVMLITPAAATGDLFDQVSDAVTDVRKTLGDAGGDGGQPRGDAPTYTPPAHGEDPHGQGTAVTFDEDPEEGLPYSDDEDGGDEEVVIGRSRGEQNPDGSYHGHVTMLALFGDEVAGLDTDEGETEDGPTGDANDDIADACSATDICVTVLDADSDTDANGSENSFVGFDADIDGPGDMDVKATTLSSSGNIRDDGQCQTAGGESDIAEAEAFDAAKIELGHAESESVDCNDGSSSQTNDSFVIGSHSENDDLTALSALLLGGYFPEGCETGEPDTYVDLFFADGFCNADDSSEDGGNQLDNPYGVREAFTIFAEECVFFRGIDGICAFSAALAERIPIPVETFKATLAASESHAAAPPAEDAPDGEQPPQALPEGEGAVQPGVGDGGVPRERPTAERLAGLPFTGVDLLTLLLIGLGVMGTGIALWALADRLRGPARL